MKTKEELSTLKKEVENMNKKLAELTEDELSEVTGGEGEFSDLYDVYRLLTETERDLRRKAEESRK